MEELIPLVRDGVLGGAALVLALRLDAVLRGLQSRLERLDDSVRRLPCQSGGECPRKSDGSRAAAILGILAALWIWTPGCGTVARIADDPAAWCAAECGAAARACVQACAEEMPEGSGLARPAPLEGGEDAGGGR